MIVYKITNTKTGKVYIGRTTQTLTKRWSQHKSRGKYYDKGTGKHSEQLYKDMFEVGVEFFDCVELHTASSIEELVELEKKVITEYDSIRSGYNLVLGDLLDIEGLTAEQIEDRNKVVSLGVKHYWDGYTAEERSAIINARIHSGATFEDRSSTVKKVWNMMDSESKDKRVSARLATLTSKKQTGELGTGRYKFTSPDGEEYDVYDVTEFSKDHDLKRNCLYHLIKGFQKSYKGWTVMVLTPPKSLMNRTIEFENIETGEIVYTKNISEFCKKYELSEGSIRCIIRGSCKKHKNWKVNNITYE